MGTATISKPTEPLTAEERAMLTTPGAAARSHGLPRGSNPNVKDDPLDAPLWAEWDAGWSAMNKLIERQAPRLPIDESASKRPGTPDWYAARGE